MLAPLPIVDTRPFFRPLFDEFGRLLATLPADAWLRPTVAPRWRVRDVVAHMVDTGLRRLSFHRDRLPPPTPPASGELVEFINRLNADFVAVSARFSPPVLQSLHDRMASELSAFFADLPLEGPALFPVSWAGEHESLAWFDIGHGQEMHLLHVDGYQASPFEGEFGRHVAVRWPAGGFAALRQRLIDAGATPIAALRPTPFPRFFVREPVNGYVFEVIEGPAASHLDQ